MPTTSKIRPPLAPGDTLARRRTGYPTSDGASQPAAPPAHAEPPEGPRACWLTQDFKTRVRRLYDRIGERTPFIEYQRRAA